MAKMTASRPSAQKPARTVADLKQEGKVRLNADISKELYKQVKVKAAMDETTITEIVKAALAEYVKK